LASSNGGSSFITNNIYASFVNRADGTTVSTGSTAASSVPLTGAANVTANPWDGTYEVWSGAASQTFILRGDSFGVNATPVWTHQHVAASSGTPGVINACNLVASAGNWSGTVIVEGLP